MKKVFGIIFLMFVLSIFVYGLVYTDSTTANNTQTQIDNQTQYIRHLESQIKFYDFAVKVFIGFFTILAVLIAIGAFLLARDRKSMRDEIVEESKFSVSKLTREFETKWQDIFNELNSRKSQIAEELAQLRENVKSDIDKSCKDLQQKITTTETVETAKVSERFEQLRKELVSKMESILAQAIIPTGIETDKEKIARKKLEEGNELDEKEDFNGAIIKYTEAITLNPSYAPAYNNRGSAYQAKGDLDQAIKDYDKAIELNPKYANAYYNRGNAYTRKIDFNSAIKDFNKAIELNPKHAMALANQGTVYLVKGDNENAKYWYERALKYREVLPDKGERIDQWLTEHGTK